MNLAREDARNANGQFGEQPKTEPEVTLGSTLTYAQEMQLGMRGPTNDNTFQDRFDVEPDDRPTRPYLALTVADDDEFFDAPPGAHLQVSRPNGETEWYERAEGGWTWHKLSDAHRSAITGSIEAGELWGSLFHETEMDASQVILPPGQHFWNWQSKGEAPTTADESRARLRESPKWEMTSRYLSGDTLEAGTHSAERGSHQAVLSADGNQVTFGDAGTFPVRDGLLFEREGDLVIRKDEDGYGFEYAFRPAS